MSVPKGERNKSKREFDDLFFTVYRDAIDTISHQFYASETKRVTYKFLIDDKSREILFICDAILRNIRVANSIYPQALSEYYDRRNQQNHAIGLCYALLTNYQIVANVIELPERRLITNIENATHLINAIRAWRKSDNHFKNELKTKAKDDAKKSDSAEAQKVEKASSEKGKDTTDKK